MRLLRRPAVQAKTGLSRTRIDVLEREGRFPKRRRISERACGWIEAEVDAWIEALPAADDVPPDTAGNLVNQRA